jgi:outer membrane protein assembly factor BamB
MQLGGAVWSSPAIANGVVYVATAGGSHSFYALSEASGAILWSYNPTVISYSSPIVVNGWVYYAATNGQLYAFSL